MNQTKQEQQLQLEGSYRLDNDLLLKGNITLKLGMRNRPKKGQARRFIGYMDLSKTEPEDQFQYISSLYSKQGTQKYVLDYQKQYYELSMTGVNSVSIKKAVKEPVLVFRQEAGEVL